MRAAQVKTVADMFDVEPSQLEESWLMTPNQSILRCPQNRPRKSSRRREEDEADEEPPFRWDLTGMEDVVKGMQSRVVCAPHRTNADIEGEAAVRLRRERGDEEDLLLMLGEEEDSQQTRFLPRFRRCRGEQELVQEHEQRSMLDEGSQQGRGGGLLQGGPHVPPRRTYRGGFLQPVVEERSPFALDELGGGLLDAMPPLDLSARLDFPEGDVGEAVGREEGSYEEDQINIAFAEGEEQLLCLNLSDCSWDHHAEAPVCSPGIAIAEPLQEPPSDDLLGELASNKGLLPPRGGDSTTTRGDSTTAGSRSSSSVSTTPAHDCSNSSPPAPASRDAGEGGLYRGQREVVGRTARTSRGVCGHGKRCAAFFQGKCGLYHNVSKKDFKMMKMKRDAFLSNALIPGKRLNAGKRNEVVAELAEWPPRLNAGKRNEVVAELAEWPRLTGKRNEVVAELAEWPPLVGVVECRGPAGCSPRATTVAAEGGA